MVLVGIHRGSLKPVIGVLEAAVRQCETCALRLHLNGGHLLVILVLLSAVGSPGGGGSGFIAQFETRVGVLLGLVVSCPGRLLLCLLIEFLAACSLS